VKPAPYAIRGLLALDTSIGPVLHVHGTIGTVYVEMAFLGRTAFEIVVILFRVVDRRDGEVRSVCRCTEENWVAYTVADTLG
jgi:hypothetical protein